MIYIVEGVHVVANGDTWSGGYSINLAEIKDMAGRQMTEDLIKSSIANFQQGTSAQVFAMQCCCSVFTFIPHTVDKSKCHSLHQLIPVFSLDNRQLKLIIHVYKIRDNLH